MNLPATLAFDHPTLTAVASYICDELSSKNAVVAEFEDGVLSSDTELEHNGHIKISGISSRYPGSSSDNLISFMEIGEEQLSKGAEFKTQIPTDRWDIEEFYEPIPGPNNNKMYTRFGSFLNRIYSFDNDLFRMNSLEATLIDPQVRLLLEEHATLNTGLNQLKRRETGIFVGCMYHEYLETLNMGAKTAIPPQAVLGNGSPYMCGRISFTFGFRGLLPVGIYIYSFFNMFLSNMSLYVHIFRSIN